MNDDGNFRDPLTMPGTWNNSAYSNFHTQSTRLNSFGGGAYGGMNDRFDMILMSNGVMADTGVYFIPGTYTPVGNDGQHFDQSINYGTNSAVPATVANSLYLASDHLPVYADFQVGSTSGINETVQNLSTVDLYPNPVAQHAFLNCRASKAGKVRISLFNSVGQEVQVFANQFIQPGAQRIQLEIDSHLSSGFYLLSIMNDNQFIYKKLSLLR